MARFSRLTVFNEMKAGGLVPVFYHGNVETTMKIVKAVWDGGCNLVEFTNRGDHACEVFSELEQYCRESVRQLIIGTGSVIDAPTAAMYVSSGTNFVVGPSLSAATAHFCNRRKIAYIPGCGTATEVAQAHELGCEIVKVFPGDTVGGSKFVKSVLGPCPWTSFMPTGGVEPTWDSLYAWFKAGVVCVGIGGNLITGDLVRNHKWDEISKKVADTLALIKKVRGEVA